MASQEQDIEAKHARPLASWCLVVLMAGLMACSGTDAASGNNGGGIIFNATDTSQGADGSVPLLDAAPSFSGDITYYSHAKAILEAACVPCHTPGENTPLYLTNYQAVYQARQAIASEVDSGRMPPWRLTPTCEDYSHDMGLSDADRGILQAWLADGAPEGYPANYIPPVVLPPAILNANPIPLTMTETYTPAVGSDEYRCVPLAWTSTVPLYISGLHIKPLARAQVHHVYAYVAPPSLSVSLAQADLLHPGAGYPCFGGPLPSDGSVVTGTPVGLVSAWTAGMGASLFPDGTGLPIAPGSTIVLQIRYNTTQVDPLPDITSVDVQVASAVERPAAVYAVTNFGWFGAPESMLIPAGQSEVTHTHSVDLTQLTAYMGADLGRQAGDPMSIYSASLHMHRLGTSGAVSLRRSNGAEDCLLDITTWDYDWQRAYTFAQPKIFNAGDTVDLRCTWDNSQANQPMFNGTQGVPQNVTWGEGEQDERCMAVLYVTALNSSGGGTCTPNCGLKQCGSDGCGGTCGTCPDSAPYCDPATFQCTSMCVPNCNLKECGDDGCGGSCGECPLTAPNCHPNTHQCTAMCIPDCPAGVQCGSDGCGGNCGVCDTNAPYCIEGLCYGDPEGTCLPDCEGKDCGANGCGGNCGICPPTSPTCTSGVCTGTCQANCTGKQCGDDGCGGNCGECPAWAPSCVNDFCVDDCVPDCIGKACGDDGCGGVCGFCTADAACISGECKLGCGNPCEGKQCGEDGCGGSCGVCGGNFFCQNGICTDGSSCNPSCFGKQCGDDGCGGSCGMCSGNLWCQNGTCVGSGCTPNCQSIQCGPDGCGGSCGTCQGNSWCQNGTCVGSGCTPNCNGKQCGNDGCGGSCGTCAAGSTCTAQGTCQGGGNTGQGECTNAADAAILNQIDAQTMATECGLGCIGDLNPAACATTCLQAQSNLSAGCSGCFGKLVGCIIDKCLTDCINPEALECTSCTSANCGASFQACSGIPLN